MTALSLTWPTGNALLDLAGAEGLVLLVLDGAGAPVGAVESATGIFSEGMPADLASGDWDQKRACCRTHPLEYWPALPVNRATIALPSLFRGNASLTGPLLLPVAKPVLFARGMPGTFINSYY